MRGLCCAFALATLGGCGFKAGSASDGGGLIDATPTQQMSIIDDTSAEFGAVNFGIGPTLSDAEITAYDTVDADAFVVGGLHARAYASALVTTGTTWDQLMTALPATPAGERYAEMPQTTAWASGYPLNLGLTSGNNFTVVYDGEIYLLGATTLQLAADDDGILQVSLDGGTTYTGVLAAYSDATPDRFTITPPANGWYPIRAAMAQTIGGENIAISLVGSDGTATPIVPGMVRARVTHDPGLLVIGAGTILEFETLGTSADAGPIAHMWSNTVPGYDLATGSNGSINATQNASNFSLRYAGQVLTDQADSEVFAVAIGSGSNDVYRLAIDGMAVSSIRWPGLTDHATSTALAMTAGWHDVVLDYSHNGGGSAGLTFERAAGSAALATIPADHLRPAVERGQLLSAANTSFNMQTSGATPASEALAITFPSGAIVDSVDYAAIINPNGGTRTNFALGASITGTTDSYPLTAMPDDPVSSADYAGARNAFTGHPAAATWTVSLTNTGGDPHSATLEAPAIAVTYHGGPQAPFATMPVFVSSPRTITGALQIDGAMLTAHIGDAVAMVEVATSLDVAGLATATWVDITGGPAPAAPANYLQYRVTFTGDGWSLASLDKVEIDYTAVAP